MGLVRSVLCTTTPTLPASHMREGEGCQPGEMGLMGAGGGVLRKPKGAARLSQESVWLC